jgi:hypothetical protein
MILWMQVTPDEYELPLVVAKSAGELARLTGQTRSNICSCISHAEKRGGKSQYVRLTVDDDE